MRTNKRVYLWTINIFIILAVLALAGTAFLTLASATITLPADREEFKSSGTITVSNEDSDDTAFGDVITKNYELSKTVAVGSKTTQASKAGGNVVITNTTSQSQPLVATTRLM